MSENSDEENLQMGYAALKLTQESRRILLSKFPAAYPVLKCDHITLGLMSFDTAQRTFSELPEDIEITGIADDGNGLAVFTARVDGEKRRAFDNKFYHITHSINPEKDAPADYDPAENPADRKPHLYRSATSNGFLREIHDENDTIKDTQQTNDTLTVWSYKELADPIKITACLVYVENKKVMPLLPDDPDTIKNNAQNPGQSPVTDGANRQTRVTDHLTDDTQETGGPRHTGPD